MDSSHYRRPAPAIEELPLFAPEPVAPPPAPEVPWYEGALAALDFETTGVDPYTCRPVSVAFCCHDAQDRDVLPSYSVVIDCGVEVPKDAAAIHGITTEQVRRGQPVVAALAHVAGFLFHCVNVGIPIVIMNARFDWPLMQTEAARHLLAVPESAHLIDPFIIDHKFDQYRRGPRRLVDLCRTYGLPALDEAHDALADARAAIGVTRAMARKYLVAVELADMARLQAEWFENFRLGRNRYWASKGDPRKIEPGWPLPERRAA